MGDIVDTCDVEVTSEGHAEDIEEVEGWFVRLCSEGDAEDIEEVEGWSLRLCRIRLDWYRKVLSQIKQ